MNLATQSKEDEQGFLRAAQLCLQVLQQKSIPALPIFFSVYRILKIQRI